LGKYRDSSVRWTVSFQILANSTFIYHLTVLRYINSGAASALKKKIMKEIAVQRVLTKSMCPFKDIMQIEAQVCTRQTVVNCVHY
jgi:hypothetical protein